MTTRRRRKNTQKILDHQFIARIFDLVEEYDLGVATDKKTVLDLIENALSDLLFERQMHNAEMDQLKNG